MQSLNKEQKKVLESASRHSVFLEGPPGSGKSTIGAFHLSNMVNAGIPAEKIIVLVPQRTLAEPYYQVINSISFPPGGLPQIVTLGGLARRMVELFWSLLAKNAGFARPDLPPRFLTLETAQYFAARQMQPLLDKGYFDSITIDQNRIFSQIIDNLNKSSIVGFHYSEIGERLKNAWAGKPEQIQVYTEAQECITLFREYCLKNNLVDFSLQIELFKDHLWSSFLFQEYLKNQYRYLIYDNIEEDVPVAHDIVRQWLPAFENYLLLFDQDGGYRVFLGSDPVSGYSLKSNCVENITLQHKWVMTPEIQHLQANLSGSILKKTVRPNPEILQQSLVINHNKYFPEMVDFVCDQVKELIEMHGVNPENICIISPFLSDSLRFEFITRMETRSIPIETHRPSRSLYEEPATQCLITLLKILYPAWGTPPSSYEFRNMLMQSITGFDLIRSDLLTKIIFRPRQHDEPLGSFGDIHPDTQERITYLIGERYTIMRDWLLDHLNSSLPLDVLLSKLFGELLSQPGFGFNDNYDAADTTARLMDSFHKFRSVIPLDENLDELNISEEYVEMIEKGVIAAQFFDTWQSNTGSSVYLSPAYTFLMSNRIVEYQFWLDIGNTSWWERLNQPLTHPYILNRHWRENDKWGDMNEYQSNQRNLQRLVNGLLYRCRKQIFLCLCEINEQGNQQHGPLLQAVQHLFRAANRSQPEAQVTDV